MAFLSLVMAVGLAAAPGSARAPTLVAAVTDANSGWPGGASVTPGSYVSPRGIVETRQETEARFSAYLGALEEQVARLEASSAGLSAEYRLWFQRELDTLKVGVERARKDLEGFRKADERTWYDAKVALEGKLILLDRTFAALSPMGK